MSDYQILLFSHLLCLYHLIIGSLSFTLSHIMHTHTYTHAHLHACTQVQTESIMSRAVSQLFTCNLVTHLSPWQRCFFFVFFFFVKHIHVWHLFRNVHPSYIYIHVSLSLSHFFTSLQFYKNFLSDN